MTGQTKEQRQTNNDWDNAIAAAESDSEESSKASDNSDDDSSSRSSYSESEADTKDEDDDYQAFEKAVDSITIRQNEYLNFSRLYH